MAKLLSTQKMSSTNMSTFINIIFLVITLFPLYHISEAATCTKKSHPPDQKPKLVFLHGFRSAGFAFFKVQLHLESLGYNCIVINCKGAGTDLTDSSTIDTFEQYHEPVDRFMSSLGPQEKVMVIGHSAGGVSITKVLHDHPDKVAVAMYISATMLKYNYLTCEDLQIGTPYFSESKCNASCPKLPDPTCFEKFLPVDGITLGSQSEEETLERMLARPGPYRALLTSRMPEAAKKNSSSIDNVPRVYVTSRLDTTFIPEKQDAMIKRWPPCEVIKVRNDHGLCYDKPQLYAALIVNATKYA